MRKIIISCLIVILITLSFNFYLDKSLNGVNSIILSSSNKSDLPDYIKDLFVFNTNIDGNKWYQNIEVDIFSDRELIYPGSTGEYKFVVKNDMNELVNFNISLFENDELKIPFLYQIKIGDNLVDLNEYTFVLGPLEEKEYTLVWEWPFDGDSEIDTRLGQSDNLTHKINFVIEVESIYEKDN